MSPKLVWIYLISICLPIYILKLGITCPQISLSYSSNPYSFIIYLGMKCRGVLGIMLEILKLFRAGSPKFLIYVKS